MSANTTQWIMALNHPLRRQVLRVVEEGGTASATELCQRFELPLSNVSYHVKVMVDLGVLELVRTRKVRGARERFYRVASDRQASWVRVVLEDTRRGDSQVRDLAQH